MRSCRAGRPLAGPPRAQPHKALALDSVIWFPIPSTGTPTSPTPVSQGAAHMVVLSLCEAAKREFGGVVQRVFRGSTSTIKLGVFEHPTRLLHNLRYGRVCTMAVCAVASDVRSVAPLCTCAVLVHDEHDRGQASLCSRLNLWDLTTYSQCGSDTSRLACRIDCVSLLCSYKEAACKTEVRTERVVC